MYGGVPDIIDFASFGLAKVVTLLNESDQAIAEQW